MDWRGHEKDKYSYSEALWGEQGRLPIWSQINVKHSDRRCGAEVTVPVLMCCPDLPGLKFPPAPKEREPGLSYQLAQI